MGDTFMWWIFALLFGIVALLLLFSYFTYRTAFFSPMGKRRGDDRFFSSDPALATVRSMFLSRVDAVRAAEFLPLTITSRDGLTLYGRYYEIRRGAPVEIGFHGYRSTALHDGPVAYESAVRNGTNLLLVDQRAHGQSDGHVITFGVLERYDVLAWVEEVCRRFGDKTEILISGVSMGAATVLLASSLPLPKNVKGVLADCPYSSPRDILRKVAGDMHLPPALAYPFLRVGAMLFGGFDPSSVSVAEAVAGSRLPILLVHGEGDTFVPCEMSRAIAEKNPTVRYETYPGADHGLSCFSDPERYRRMCDDFRRAVLSSPEENDAKKSGNTP